MAALRRHRKKLALLAGLIALPLALRGVLVRVARPTPPAVAVEAREVERPREGLARFGSSYALTRGDLLEVGLRGRPEQIGFAHSRLLYRHMVENEGILLSRFREQVPSALFRNVLLDLARLRYHSVDAGMSPARLREIAAGALGFQPDPYSELLPTYQRFVYLNALYDIALSFEESPLIGCTTFTFGGSSVAEGGGVLARAFDFEVDDIFDRRKAVFLVREEGKIPFASVAWPGLVGVVSGMNVEGLAAVVHGARAGTPRAEGEPVVHALRRVLSEARTVDDAVALLGQRAALVSHLIVLTDASGTSLAVERVPGEPPHARRLPERAAVTNHLEGPFSEDPRNLRVLETTSTRERRARGDELVQGSGQVSPASAVALLRDRKGPGGKALPLGDRRAIDALIATHGVVMETARRVLWVSEPPHLLGRFVAFDLQRLLAPDYDPARADALETLPADPLKDSAEYRALKQ